MSAPYILDFGPTSTGLTPSFLTFIRVDGGGAVTAPAIVELSGGKYSFTYDWTTAPAGVTGITFTASSNGTTSGIILDGVITLEGSVSTPIYSAPALTSAAGIPSLPTGVLEASGRFFADFLVQSVKRGAKIPISQATVDTWEILSTADEQMRAYMVPLHLSVGEDYMTAYADLAITSARQYRAPSRSMKIRDIQVLNSLGNPIEFPRVAIEEIPYHTDGFYFVGNVVTLLSTTAWQGYTLRIWYYLRPSRLVTASEVGVASSVNTGTGAITMYGAVTGLTGAAVVDLVAGQPPFDVRALDVPCSVSGATVTITAPANIPADWGVAGDLVCLPQQTPAPQIHPDLWRLLVEAIVVDLLDGTGDDAAFQRATARMARFERDAKILLAKRVEGEEIPVGGYSPLWSRSWSGLRLW